jgi:hypothetical protein
MKKMLNEGNQIHNFIPSSGSDFLTSYGSDSTTLARTLRKITALDSSHYGIVKKSYSIPLLSLFRDEKRD